MAEAWGAMEQATLKKGYSEAAEVRESRTGSPNVLGVSSERGPVGYNEGGGYVG